MREKCKVLLKKLLPVMIVAVLSISLANIPIVAEDFGSCGMCHKEIADNFATSLHYTNKGMILEWQRGAGDFCALNGTEYFEEKHCFNCHIKSCDRCHKDYGMYPTGHGKTVGLETCDECHGKKRVASHFVGDWAGHKKEGPHADIHYEKGLNCTDCHTVEDIHGDGMEYSTELLAVKVQCEDCHMSPGKVVKGMDVTQFSTDTEAHSTHEGKLDCTACHAGWYQNCINCHVDTKKLEGATIEEFNLGIAGDGEIKPFYHMTAVCPDNRTHSAYFEFMPHTITNKSKDCAFCHESREVLCEGCEGQLLGPPGASFIPQEVIDRIIGAHKRKPTITISTDKFVYSPGDTMTITISISNPTPDNVTFQCYWGVPQYTIWVQVMSVPIPAEYNETFNFSIPVPYLGLKPTGNVFYVQLLNTSGGVLDANAASWACGPGGTVMPPTGITEQINKTLSEVNIRGEITKALEKVGLPS